MTFIVKSESSQISDNISIKIRILRNDLITIIEQLEEKIKQLENLITTNIEDIDKLEDFRDTNFPLKLGVSIMNISDFNGYYTYVYGVLAFFTTNNKIDIEDDRKKSIFLSIDLNSIIIYSESKWLIVKYQSLNITEFLNISSNNLNNINSVTIIDTHFLTTETYQRTSNISMPQLNENIKEF